MKKMLRKLEGENIEEKNVNPIEEEGQMTEQDFLQAILAELDNKTLNLTGDFNIKMLEHVQEFARRLYFYESDPHKNIRINISSNGGEANVLFAIISILEELKQMWSCTITTVVKGWAYSCGAIAWLYGDYREMTDLDEIMVHQILYGCMGSLQDHAIELKRSEKVQKKVDKIITMHTPLTQKQLNKWYKTGQDTFLDYEDCMKLGLIKEEEFEENEKEEKGD